MNHLRHVGPNLPTLIEEEGEEEEEEERLFGKINVHYA